MSLTCESTNTSTTINKNESEDSQAKKTKLQPKDNYEDEELDFEEEVEQPIITNDDNQVDDDGELDDDDQQHEVGDKLKKPFAINKKIKQSKTDRDEGEIDSEEELEEGEVKEDDDDNEQMVNIDSDIQKQSKTSDQQNENSTTSSTDNSKNSQRIKRPLLSDNGRKPYYPNPLSLSSYYHQNYSNSRFVNQRSDHPHLNRYNMSIRSREPPLPPSIQQSSSSVESAWERGLKQARELISRASKRKEEDEDFENKRYNLSSKDRSPLSSAQPAAEKRRRHSSSEDEFERRHRLAYDAAPWNNPAAASAQQPGSCRRNYYNRSAETYRDPWRRSKSPKNSSRNRRLDDIEPDARYGETLYKRDKTSRSDSMSSLSSICSSSNFSDRSDKSSGRKLPYSRPHLESSRNSSRKVNDDDSLYDREYGNKGKSSRFDRIPKKSHAMQIDKSDDQKSFDSWSESLSDSSSYYSNSESDDDADEKDNTIRDYMKNKYHSSNKNKAGSDHHRHLLQSSLNRLSSSHKNRSSTHQEVEMKKLKSKNIETTKDGGSSSKYQTKTATVQEPVKVPIKMTFMKKQQSLKKDNIIDEQLNGNLSGDDIGDGDCSSYSRLSNKSGSSRRLSLLNDQTEKLSGEDDIDEEPRSSMADRSSPKDSSSSSSSDRTSSSSSSKRREKLLMKLKAVEEAIERKLNSKN